MLVKGKSSTTATTKNVDYDDNGYDPNFKRRPHLATVLCDNFLPSPSLHLKDARLRASFLVAGFRASIFFFVSRILSKAVSAVVMFLFSAVIMTWLLLILSLPNLPAELYIIFNERLFVLSHQD